MPPRTLTLTTDFGEQDAYVAQMKGVVLTIAPEARILDLGHALPRQDVHAAQRFVAEAVPRFPPGTVHVCVIDPGVGGPRRPMALRWREQTLVGPDNGLFTPFLDDPTTRVVVLDRRERWLDETSSTFHGRDVFAPVGAHLVAGATLEEVGSPLADPLRLATPAPRLADGVLLGEVLHVDHFGNLLTNVSMARLCELAGDAAPRYRVRAGAASLEGPARSYDAVASGELLTLIGSAGAVEIAVREGRADERLGIARGAPVRVELIERADG